LSWSSSKNDWSGSASGSSRWNRGRRLSVGQTSNGHGEGGKAFWLGDIEIIGGQRAPLREYGLAAAQNSIYL
jgi:hypothetical protein